MWEYTELTYYFLLLYILLIQLMSYHQLINFHLYITAYHNTSNIITLYIFYYVFPLYMYIFCDNIYSKYNSFVLVSSFEWFSTSIPFTTDNIFNWRQECRIWNLIWLSYQSPRKIIFQVLPKFGSMCVCVCVCLCVCICLCDYHHIV